MRLVASKILQSRAIRFIRHYSQIAINSLMQTNTSFSLPGSINVFHFREFNKGLNYIFRILCRHLKINITHSFLSATVRSASHYSMNPGDFFNFFLKPPNCWFNIPKQKPALILFLKFNSFENFFFRFFSKVRKFGNFSRPGCTFKIAQIFHSQLLI